MVKVSPIENSQCAESASVLARSFLHDPVTSAILPQLELRRLVLFHFFYCVLRNLGNKKNSAKHVVYETEGSGENCIRGTAIWTKGHIYDIWFFITIIFQLLWFVGLPMIPLSFRVIKEFKKQYLNASKKAMSDKEYWYLDVIGVDSLTKGHGYGGHVIEKQLQQCDKLQIDCYLESSNPMNIPFYQKHGFIVEDTFEFFGVPVTAMSRKPNPIKEE